MTVKQDLKLCVVLSTVQYDGREYAANERLEATVSQVDTLVDLGAARELTEEELAGVGASPADKAPAKKK